MEARVGIEPAYTELQFYFFKSHKYMLNNMLCA